MIGKGDNYFHVVYIDDVIQALVLAMQPIARNKIYHIAGPDPHTYKETYELITEALGAEMPERSVPVLAVKAAALAHELQSKATGQKPHITLMRSSIDRLVRNRIIDITKAEQQLGYQPQFTLKKALKQTVKELGV
jgi:nucleoside-diphosphate-sugar epimerase